MRSAWRTPQTRFAAEDSLTVPGFTVLGVLAVGAVIGLWAWRSFSDPAGYDFSQAYYSGEVAWSTGRPETWFSWTGTPLLAAAMAVTGRLWDEVSANRILTGVNIALVLSVIGVVVRRLRNTLSPLWLLIVAVGIASFGPILSTVWWKQFNIIVLFLALAGFEALRRDRFLLAGALIGFSVGLKPLVFLLPLVLLARRSTRLTGIWGVVFAVGLNIGAQGLYAIHAHAAAAFDPLSPARNFLKKSRPGSGYYLACGHSNFSSQALLCRTFGAKHWTLLTIVVWLALVCLAVWVVRALHGYDTASWECFAFTCVFSTMASSIDWSHYQVMLAPLIVLLVVRFSTVRTHALYWFGLLVAFVLASLTWSPYGAITDALQLHFRSTYQTNPHPLVANIAQYSQYILIVTATLWYRRHGRTVLDQSGSRRVGSQGDSLRPLEAPSQR